MKRGTGGGLDVAGLIEITRGDYNRGFGYRTALGCPGLLRQYAKTNSTSGFGAICRTKYLAARGCVEISIAGGSADQKRQAPGSRTVLAIPPQDFIAES